MIWFAVIFGEAVQALCLLSCTGSARGGRGGGPWEIDFVVSSERRLGR